MRDDDDGEQSEPDANGSDVPPAAECQKRIDSFTSVTGADEAYAQMMLQRAKWDLNVAVNRHMEKEVNIANTINRSNSVPPSVFGLGC